MKTTDIVIGETGYTDGYGCDRYPHTVVGVAILAPTRGRKPKGWIKGSTWVEVTVRSDDTVTGKKPKNALEKTACTGDIGFEGKTADFWFVPNPLGQVKTVRAIELPNGDILCNGLGHRSYNRDSSF